MTDSLDTPESPSRGLTASEVSKITLDTREASEESVMALYKAVRFAVTAQVANPGWHTNAALDDAETALRSEVQRLAGQGGERQDAQPCFCPACLDGDDAPHEYHLEQRPKGKR